MPCNLSIRTLETKKALWCYICCATGRDTHAPCMSGKATEDIFAWRFRSLCFKRSESAFWLRSSLLSAGTLCLLIYFHCLVPSGGALFCGKRKKGSLQWQSTIGALVTIQNILRADKSSQHAISWWYFSFSRILTELIQCLCLNKEFFIVTSLSTLLWYTCLRNAFHASSVA